MSEVRGGFWSVLCSVCPKCGAKHHQDYAYCDGRRTAPIWWDKPFDKEDNEIFEKAIREVFDSCK